MQNEVNLGKSEQTKEGWDDTLAKIAQEWFDCLEDQTVKAMVSRLIQSQQQKFEKDLWEIIASPEININLSMRDIANGFLGIHSKNRFCSQQKQKAKQLGYSVES